jgi:twitching motility protein PilT
MPAAWRYSLLNEEQRAKFDRDWELCISLPHSAAGRIRVTFYRRDGHPELSIRFCGERIPSREELGLPAKIDELALRTNGLVLITGPTGSGKTTTLNYMIDLINSERRCKVVTIEDPIEYVHRNKRAIVVQQEVLTDTHSFNRALIHVLRQDPDVIVVGEMREHEAISAALTAAETGHLVLATLHSPNVMHAFERITGVFEGNLQRQVIIQLANSLLGVIAQDLLPAVDRSRRVLAYELLVANGAVRNLIREGNKHMLETSMQTGGKDGMVLMDACLYDLYCRCLISYDTALSRARIPTASPNASDRRCEPLVSAGLRHGVVLPPPRTRLMQTCSSCSWSGDRSAGSSAASSARTKTAPAPCCAGWPSPDCSRLLVWLFLKLGRVYGKGSSGSLFADFGTVLFLVGAIALCSIFLGILWAPQFGSWLAHPIVSLFDGGTQQLEPQPLYAVAQAHMQTGALHRGNRRNPSATRHLPR